MNDQLSDDEKEKSNRTQGFLILAGSGLLLTACVFVIFYVRGIRRTAALLEICKPASPEQFEYLQAGVSAVLDSNHIDAAYAIFSHDLPNMYFVGAHIQGPGLGSDEIPAIWVISGTADSPLGITSANAYADNFSIFPQLTFEESMVIHDQHGYKELLDCLEYYKP